MRYILVYLISTLMASHDILKVLFAQSRQVILSIKRKELRTQGLGFKFSFGNRKLIATDRKLIGRGKSQGLFILRGGPRGMRPIFT